MQLCKDCKINKTETPKSHRCKPCKRKYATKLAQEWRIRTGKTKHPGVGKGGNPLRGKDNPMYKHGGFTSAFSKKEIKEFYNHICCRCQKDLKNASRYHWCVHHKDHDHFNNPTDGSNWELLCKRCHQIEHKCWEAFQRSTTIPKGSTQRTKRRGKA